MRGADKPLYRPTSRYRRTESIVWLERGLCSCAELQVFSCYRGWKEASQATSAILTSRRDLVISQNRKSLSETFNVLNRLIFYCNFYKLHFLSFELYFLNQLQNALHTYSPTWIFIIMFLVRIPCIIEHVGNEHQNSLNYILLFHVMAPTCLGNNYAIFKEQLSSFWVT
jgi:hypothetical protein